MNWAGIGSVFMFLAVALGAFAAHGLKSKITPELLSVFEVGVRYQAYHALALFAVAWAADKNLGAPVPMAGWLFVAGTFIFSGSLYALSLSGFRWWGAVTPIGGLCFLAGWACLAWSFFRQRA